jgi:hypothetical protein
LVIVPVSSETEDKFEDAMEVTASSPLFEIALVLVRFDHVARFIVNALTTISPLGYARRYDYQISCAHFCNWPCQHLCCPSSIARPGPVARSIAFTGKTSHAQKSRSDGLTS